MHVEMKAKSLDELQTLPLGQATAQDIQLELIRHWQFNAFDGPRVAAKLMEHRGLWDAVMMDRLAIFQSRPVAVDGADLQHGRVGRHGERS